MGVRAGEMGFMLTSASISPDCPSNQALKSLSGDSDADRRSSRCPNAYSPNTCKDSTRSAAPHTCRAAWVGATMAQAWAGVHTHLQHGGADAHLYELSLMPSAAYRWKEHPQMIMAIWLANGAWR